ncbi:glycosyltransferase family 2 protein [Priestia megaterium]
MKKMISVIVPTTGDREEEFQRLCNSLDKQDYKNFELIVCSQKNHEKIESILQEFHFDKNHVKLDKLGLSNARNIGITHAKGEIVTFSDDDCWYLKDSFSNVIKTFNENNSDVACFQMFDPTLNEYLKNYPVQSKSKLSMVDLFSKSSIEIFINMSTVKLEDIYFDVNFGLGAIYSSGEENILLSDLFRKSYNISYFPIVIVYHPKKISSQSHLSYQHVISKGPLFSRIYNKPLGLILLTLFFFKKYSKIENPFKLYFHSLKSLQKYNTKLLNDLEK